MLAHAATYGLELHDDALARPLQPTQSTHTLLHFLGALLGLTAARWRKKGFSKISRYFTTIRGWGGHAPAVLLNLSIDSLCLLLAPHLTESIPRIDHIGITPMLRCEYILNLSLIHI